MIIQRRSTDSTYHAGPRPSGTGNQHDPHRWALILAGGDGARLRSLTRFLSGDERPKQFCSLLTDDTLLQQTRRRAERSVDPERILYSLTAAHEPYFLRDPSLQPEQRIVQPCNRGTAPAIVSALVQISGEDPEAVVAVLPCDHYFDSDAAFTEKLDSAYALAESCPSSLVLLGAEPSAPETEYGWIETDGLADRPGAGVYRVKRFHEKPRFAAAQRLFRAGALWNTFVMVGRVAVFLDMASEFVPGILQPMRSLARTTRTTQIDLPSQLYDQIPMSDFSTDVLTPGSRRLVVLSLGRLAWNDLGDAERVLTTASNDVVRPPAWVARWRGESEARRPKSPSALGAFA
jgi:mannose-1-phosphate guanylyltransferase